MKDTVTICCRRSSATESITIQGAVVSVRLEPNGYLQLQLQPNSTSGSQLSELIGSLNKAMSSPSDKPD